MAPSDWLAVLSTSHRSFFVHKTKLMFCWSLSACCMSDSMPRTYESVPGHAYRRYTPEAMEGAVAAVRNDGQSIRSASATFNVPRKTLSDKINAKHPLKSGGQSVFSPAEGREIVVENACLSNVKTVSQRI